MPPTEKQILGKAGEIFVIRNCDCPKCKHSNTLRLLPPNFKCADVICDFCGYLAQVKTATSKDVGKLPKILFGAAWGVQKDRMAAGIYFPLFIVLVKSPKEYAIYYLPADLQTRSMFLPRNPLSKNARRAGWQGFNYRLASVAKGGIVRLH